MSSFNASLTHDKDLLRFITCGNVDDGKSTLIGRLLHDSKQVFEDQLSALERDSKRYNSTEQEIDLALLVDGLQAEREQAITIDVAYRYFSTDKRKFIIADCPGHIQYTRNMATGASTSQLAIILIDARYGIQTQTRRHSYIVHLLGIKHVILAVNKMDLVNYQAEPFEHICEDYQRFANQLGIKQLYCVPISALNGDNIVHTSAAMASWYSGSTLLHSLETIPIHSQNDLQAFRFPVQYVNRPHLDFRGYCGTIAAGQIAENDAVTVLPSGQTSRVKQIVNTAGTTAVTQIGSAITLTLHDEIDISRGDMLVRTDEPAPTVTLHMQAHVVWMQNTALALNQEYTFKLAGKYITGHFTHITHRIDVDTFAQHAAHTLQLNEIALCHIRLHAPVVIDPYSLCKTTGSFIIIDRLSNATAGAGMVEQAFLPDGDSKIAATEQTELARLKQFEKALNQLVREHFPEWGCKPVL